jgi:hypothetical protein
MSVSQPVMQQSRTRALDECWFLFELLIHGQDA